MKNLIREVHDSDIFGCFIETGCGVPVSSSLLNEAGASNTVFMTESPYSKEYSNIKYNNAELRAVSIESLNSILFKYNNYIQDGTINTIYIASFQVGHKNNISTHGWILLSYNNIIKYYHISIHEPLTRRQYIERIGENGIKLIHSRNRVVPNDCDVDIVLNHDLSYDYETTLKFISQNTREQFSIFSENKIDRLESITRNTDTLVLFKGSFDPIQIAHVDIINECANKYNIMPYFMISFNVIEKGHQHIDSIMFRIKLLMKLGYSVVICNKPFFKQNLDFIKQKYNKKVVFAMGLDTVNRLLNDYCDDINKIFVDFNGAEIVVNNRNGSIIPSILREDNMLFSFVEDFGLLDISSTKVRQLIRDGKLDEVIKMIPKDIVDLIIPYYSN